MGDVLQAKFQVPAGAPALDDFDTSLGAMPTDVFVVTRDRFGEPASRFGDFVWDFTAYTHDGRQTRRSFVYWEHGDISEQRAALIREAKLLVFALIWRKEGAALSPGTVSNYITVLCALCVHAEMHDISLATLLGDEKAVLNFVRTSCSGWMAETLGSLLGHFTRLGKEHLGFELVSTSAVESIKKRNKHYRSTLKQHPPMPTAIYSHFIHALKSELAGWQAVATPMLELLSQCGADRRVGRTIEQQLFVCKKWGLVHECLPTFEQLASPEVVAYIESCGKKPHVKSLSYQVNEAQVVCKLLIQTFAGMRDDEAASLPYDCISTRKVNGKTHYIINGYTTKYNGGLIKPVKWVTNQDGHDAIRAAQAIADSIYSVFGVRPQEAGKETRLPLFVSLGYMKLASGPMDPEHGRFLAGGVAIRDDSRLWDVLQPVISDADLRELENIDPHRAWRDEEKFKVGTPWSFTTHQLRRSLALYAQRSGLVSLPSLRRQMQHLTEDMSRYYARGSSFAEDFIGDDKDHFGREWQATQPESAALSYFLNVLLTDDRLFGGHAHWVKHRLKGPEGVVIVDRDATMKRFKRGEMAYRETMLGGCTNTGSCDKPGVNWLDIECVRDNCKNLVGSVPKLDRVIVAQRRMLDGLDPTTTEYHTDKADLDILIAARDAAVAI